MNWRGWWSDTLLLAALNAAAYVWAYWAADWQVPHFGTYFGWIGAVISTVPSPRELRDLEYRRAALLGLWLSATVALHAITTPCSGPCK